MCACFLLFIVTWFDQLLVYLQFTLLLAYVRDNCFAGYPARISVGPICYVVCLLRSTYHEACSLRDVRPPICLGLHT
jgi:hypothetical protein